MICMKKKKFQFKSENWNPCPMGTLFNDRIECYYFGITEIKDCNKCDHRK